MQKDRLSNLIHLQIIVFIYGFTAILGKLISIDSLPLVWYRMGLASLFILVYIRFSKFTLRVNTKTLLWFTFAGIIVALHWVTFFLAIKASTVSVALAMMSTGALFTAIIEPIVYNRKIVGYELLLGLLVILGLYLIFRVESNYVYGMIIALISSFLAAVFSIVNAQLVKKNRPSVISFYELVIGTLFLTLLLSVTGGFTFEFFRLEVSDWWYLIVLSLVCTSYAFIASVKIMRVLTAYTVMLTNNLEPVYGILLALVFFGSEEKMNSLFYVGALIIFATVITNGILKHRASKKQSSPKG
ncbi:DMT family transporter [Maribacter antarcticus]|uniref:DMT family transporter n=1 Tax=Maribacter antarcticus TaxID=505250 RepID=UPI00047DA693|nr:DMT family transporter [Maribacter antarcticus]